MRRVTESQPISLEEVRTLAAQRFGDMIKGVVDLKRGILLLDADLHADQEASLLADSMINLRPSFGNRSRGVDDSATRAAIAGLVARVVRR
jgi:hypothetical protein